MSAPNPSLRKAMTMRYAVALYMSSVVGSAVIVLPGLAAQIAGRASLVAWVALSIISYPLAYTFASLSARRPESGGVYPLPGRVSVQEQRALWAGCSSYGTSQE